MRIRQLITRITVVVGIVAASAGLLTAWQTDDMFVGSVWMLLGVGLMAAGTVYSLAMDDPESRATALTTHRHRSTDASPHSIDLRGAVTAPTSREKTTPSTRVSV